MTFRQIIRATAVLSATTTIVLGAGGMAAADVTVSSSDRTPGSTTVLDFAVSDLRDSPTTKVEITLPTGQAFATVAARPKIGWDTMLMRPAAATTGPVTSVVWTLTDNRFGIAPGAFDVFSLQLGPLPASGSLVFPIVATYQNSAVDSWAPMVAAPAPAPPAEPAPAAAAKPDNQSRVTAGLSIGGAAILLAVLGATVGRRRKPAEALGGTH
jgi:uncharacterized protein YcnI